MIHTSGKTMNNMFVSAKVCNIADIKINAFFDRRNLHFLGSFIQYYSELAVYPKVIQNSAIGKTVFISHIFCCGVVNSGRLFN